MYKKYKDKQKRASYLREYRRRNRERLNVYLLNYLKKTGKKYYKSRISEGYSLRGTCEMGRRYELLALNFLKGAKDCNKDNPHGQYDIEWNSWKIDVKSRNEDDCGGWKINCRKPTTKDYYLIFCIRNNDIVKTYLLPSIYGGKTVYIGKDKSKFDKYRIII